MNIDDAIKFAHDGTHGIIAAALAREVVRLRRCANGIDVSDLEIVAQWGDKYDPPQHYFQALSRVQNAIRAIPAGRVLGEGMVALRRFAERCAQRDHQPDEHIGTAKCVACEAEDALRAIPADRVLVDGMVQVGREGFESATRWTFDGIDIHKVEHKKGFWFAVRRGNSCMSRSGEWQLEPLPRSRTPEFFAEIRFDTFRDALTALRANQGGAAT